MSGSTEEKGRTKRHKIAKAKVDSKGPIQKPRPRVSKVDEIFSKVRGFTQHSDLSVPFMGRCTIKNEGNREARVQIEVIVPDTPKLRLRKQKSFSFRKFGNDGAFARAQMLRRFVRIMKRLPLPYEEDYMFRAEGGDEDLVSRLSDFITELMDRGEIEGFDINKFLQNPDDTILTEGVLDSDNIVNVSIGQCNDILYDDVRNDDILPRTQGTTVFDPYENYEIPSEKETKFRETFEPVIKYLDPPTKLCFGATCKTAHSLVYNRGSQLFSPLYSEYQIHRNDVSLFPSAYKMLTGVPLLDTPMHVKRKKE